MKYWIVLFTFSFLGVSNLFSQRDFRNGYIIKNNNDTTLGLINYKGNRGSAKKCQFKNSETSETQEYTPADIKAYRFIEWQNVRNQVY